MSAPRPLTALRLLFGIAVAAFAFGHTAVARADYTETFCSGGTPAPPWAAGGGGGTAWGESEDGCAGGGFYGFDNATSTIAFNGQYGISLNAPSGLVFTHATTQYTTAPWTGGSQAFVEVGYGASTEVSGGETVPAMPAIVTADNALPDATTFWLRFDCSTNGSTTCNFSQPQDTFDVSATTMTLNDTASPSVSATGGSFANGATVSGTGTALFDATDTGSGVQKVTLSLGSTVVGTYTSTCQQPALAPCPATVNNAISADTTQVANGTYPVILTAYDVSGDATPVQAGTVNVANPVATPAPPTTTSTTTTTKKGKRLNIKMFFKWLPISGGTRLEFVTVGGKVPKKARISLTCVGKGCPFTRVKGTGTHLAKLIKKLHRRRFGGDDKLVFLATAPHRTAQRALINIRKGRYPTAVNNLSAKRLAKIERPLEKQTAAKHGHHKKKTAKQKRREGSANGDRARRTR